VAATCRAGVRDVFRFATATTRIRGWTSVPRTASYGGRSDGQLLADGQRRKQAIDN